MIRPMNVVSLAESCVPINLLSHRERVRRATIVEAIVSGSSPVEFGVIIANLANVSWRRAKSHLDGSFHQSQLPESRKRRSHITQLSARSAKWSADPLLGCNGVYFVHAVFGIKHLVPGIVVKHLFRGPVVMLNREFYPSRCPRITHCWL